MRIYKYTAAFAERGGSLTKIIICCYPRALPRRLFEGGFYQGLQSCGVRPVQ